MTYLTRLFNRRWWKITLLVILAMGVMVRLGIWQLDRLAQRRAFNARVQAQMEASTLHLQGAALTEDLPSMEYRQVQVTGEYDFAHQVALRNQAWQGQFGVHLVTPLEISGTQTAVLVDRGWIPYDDFQNGDWSKYDEPGLFDVTGVIRLSQTRPTIGRQADPTPAPGEGPLKAWNMANIAGITAQIPYSALPVYVQQAPDPAWTQMPYRTQPEIDLTEGPHLGYALQWFSFALILGVGYVFYARQEEEKAKKPARREHSDHHGHAFQG
ncbi:MAG: SURF1 family protein [Anaerolineales bacterium]